MGIEVTNAIVHLVAKKEKKLILNTLCQDLTSKDGTGLKNFLEKHIVKSLANPNIRFAKFNEGEHNIIRQKFEDFNYLTKDIFISHSQFLAEKLYKEMSDIHSSASFVMIEYIDNCSTTNIAILKMDFSTAYRNEIETKTNEDGTIYKVIKLVEIKDVIPGNNQKLHKCVFINSNSISPFKILDLQASKSNAQSDVAKYFVNFLNSTLMNDEKSNTSNFTKTFKTFLTDHYANNSTLINEKMKKYKDYIKINTILNIDNFASALLDDTSMINDFKKSLDKKNCDYSFTLSKEWIETYMKSIIYMTNDGFKFYIPADRLDDVTIEDAPDGTKTLTLTNMQPIKKIVN